MLSALLIWTTLYILLYIYGWGVTAALGRLARLPVQPQPHFTLIWLTGLVAVTTLASFLSLVMPLAWGANLLLLAGALAIVGYALRQKQIPFLPRFEKPAAPLASALLALILLVLLENATHRPANPDSGIYHVQFIRWIETYPVVPGLANLYGPYGFNSSWLVANGLFSFAFLELQSFHLLPGALALACLVYFASGAGRILQRAARPSDWIGLGMVPLTVEILSSEFPAPGTDLPVTLFLMVILLEWIRLSEEKSPPGLRQMLLVILCCFCLTIKPSTLPIMLIALAAVGQFLRGRAWRPLASLLAAGAFIFIPWLARSVIISGYLVFPFYELDLFDLDWKVPPSWAQSERFHVTYLNRYRGIEVAELMSWDFTTWVSYWYSIQPIPRLVLVWTAVGMPYLYLVYLLLRWRERKAILQRWQPYLFAALVIYIGMVYWFLVSPLIRFVYGYLISALALTLLPPVDAISRLFAPSPAAKDTPSGYFSRPTGAGSVLRLLPSIFIILMILYHAVFLLRSFESETFVARLALPADYIQLPYHPCRGYNMTLSCADFYGECWYNPFPCLPGLSDKIGQRGPRLEDGFFSRDLEQERTQKR